MLWNDLLTPFWRIAWRLLAGLLVAGCAALPPSPGSLAVARRDAIDDFSLEARFSLRHEDQNYSGRLSWRHSGGDDELLLASPFGQGIAQLTSDPRGARLTMSDGQVYAAEDGAALTRQVLGYPLPVAQLADWVRGRGAAIEADQRGRPPARAVALCGCATSVSGLQRRSAARRQPGSGRSWPQTALSHRAQSGAGS